MREWIIFDLILLFCIAVMILIGIWALRRKTPMHFWAGTTVDPETITDIPRYNKANALMWFAYCVPMIIAMFVAPFSIKWAGIITVVGTVGGLPVLIITYGWIKRKYTKM